MDTFTLGNIKWHVHSDDRDRVYNWIIDNFIDLLEDTRALLKRDTGSRVGARDGLVLKESTARRTSTVLKFGLRRSGSRKAYISANRLIASGILTPKPLAWATVRYYGLRARDYLITEEVGDSIRLTDILRQKNYPEIDDVIARLGRIAAAFHAFGYSNRDLKDSNILVKKGPPKELWVIDLDGVKRIGRVSVDRARKDLWPIVRSLRIFGWETEQRSKLLLESYRVSYPEMHLDRLPDSGAGVVAEENL